MAKTGRAPMEHIRKVECSIILVDLSGFTQLIYHASFRDEVMDIVLRAMHRLFDEALKVDGSGADIKIINNTGDGFIAIATGKTPSRTAVAFAEHVHTQFKHYVASTIASVPFRQRTDLRIALHHGHVHELDIHRAGEPTYQVYIGDDLNLLSRVVNSQVARRRGVAITRAFLRRLTLSKGELPMAEEVILDRNRYPEQIEIYALPASIKELKKR